MLGQLLDGRYRLLKVLGAGGFSQTYVAEDTRRPGNPHCVVKHLKPANTNSNFLVAARRLFDKEAKILEKLGDHDRIPRLLAYFEENQEFYLVQELIDGQLLSAELFGDVALCESQVIQLLQEISSILDFVHHHGAIHRDVKPSNIIRRQKDNKLVLVDFGIVKEINVQQVTAQSQMSVSMAFGTVGYMPPEQARGKPQFNSDIYALGIIAIQALTGFSTKDLKENTKGEIDWQSHAQVSDRLAAIISKMVRYDFRERYQSATEVIDALQSLSVQAGAATIQLEPPRRSAPTQPASNLPTEPSPNPNLPSFERGLQPSGLARLAALIKSPLGILVGIVAVVSVLATFGLHWMTSMRGSDAPTILNSNPLNQNPSSSRQQGSSGTSKYPKTNPNVDNCDAPDSVFGLGSTCPEK